MKQQIVNQRVDIPSDMVLEQVMTQGNIEGLSSPQIVSLINKICDSLSLNPYTMPILVMKAKDGKKILYFSKNATEQIRCSKGVTITSLETRFLNETVYEVKAYAELPSGRKDVSTGVVDLSGMKGEYLANCMMKCETKAKRRVTLSICGLGFIDESEAESIPGAVKIDIYKEADNEKNSNVSSDIQSQNVLSITVKDDDNRSIHTDIDKILCCDNEDDLYNVASDAYKYWCRKQNKENIKMIVENRDLRKKQLMEESLGDIPI